MYLSDVSDSGRFRLVLERTTVGFGPEAIEIDEWSQGIKESLNSSVELESLRQRFSRLVSSWRADTLMVSSTSKITSHRSYLEAIALGPVALPLIFEDIIRNGTAHWYVALSAITGADPIPESHYGDISAMNEDWLQWGRDNNYVV